MTPPIDEQDQGTYEKTQNSLHRTLSKEDQINEGSGDDYQQEVGKDDYQHEEPKAKPLPFSEFQERWNAISDEYTLENYIVSLQKVENEPYYLALLDHGHLQLKLFKDREHINRIQVVENGFTSSDHLLMISAWWQMVLITNSVDSLSDIDILLAGVGVGPNADVTAVQNTTFTYGGVHYSVSKEGGHYLFEATYP